MGRTETTYTAQKAKGQCPLKQIARKPEKFAYILVVGLFFNVMVTLGVARSLVIYLRDFQEYYQLNYKQAASFIAVFMSAGGLAGILIAILCKKFGARPICVLCSLLGTISWLVASLYVAPKFKPGNPARSLDYKVFILFTGIAGLCHGGVLVNAPVEINKWFPRSKRSVANAVVWAGSSFGAIWIPPTFKKIIQIVDQQAAATLPAAEALAPNQESSSSNVRNTGWLDSLTYLAIIQGVIMVITCCLLREPERPFLDQSDQERPPSEMDDSDVKMLPDSDESSPVSSSLSDGNEKEIENHKNRKNTSTDEPSLRQLNKYRIYKVYIIMQVFYGLWRAGVVTWIVEYAETAKNFGPTESSLLITYWAVCELITRPLVGHLASEKNRFQIIAILFTMQCFFTALIPRCDNYYIFMVLIMMIGALQGGTGGLFMTAAVDSVGVKLARYSYSVENTIDVVVAGGVVHLYGRMVDKAENSWSNPQDKIFYYAATFIFIAAICSFIASKMKQFKDHAKEEYRSSKNLNNDHDLNSVTNLKASIPEIVNANEINVKKDNLSCFENYDNVESNRLTKCPFIEK